LSKRSWSILPFRVVLILLYGAATEVCQMSLENEKAIAWLRQQVVNSETPPAIREELKRHLQAYRQSADDVFEEEPSCEESLQERVMTRIQPFHC
jgi:hypothetical protein